MLQSPNKPLWGLIVTGFFNFCQTTVHCRMMTLSFMYWFSASPKSFQTLLFLVVKILGLKNIQWIYFYPSLRNNINLKINTLKCNLYLLLSINTLKRTEVSLECNKQLLILQLSSSLDFDQNILDKNQGFFQKDACQHQEDILNKIVCISAHLLITEHQIIQRSISYMITTVHATISVLCTPQKCHHFSIYQLFRLRASGSWKKQT